MHIHAIKVLVWYFVWYLVLEHGAEMEMMASESSQCSIQLTYLCLQLRYLVTSSEGKMMNGNELSGKVAEN